MATVSSNIQPPQPVTLCYKRIHKLLPHKHSHSHNTDATPASPHASPRASARAPSQQQPPVSPRAAHSRITPASYPCPPLYRNKRRLPFVQQQWYSEWLRNEHRRHSTALPWEHDDVKEIRADWSWTVGRLTRRIAKADGVHITKGGRRRSLDGEQEAMGGGEEKRVMDEAVAGEQQSAMWNTQSLLIQVDTAEAKYNDDERVEREEKKHADEDGDEKAFDSVTPATFAADSNSPIRPARAILLSPTRQRRVSEEEEESLRATQSLHTLTITPALPSSPSASDSSSRRFSFHSSPTVDTNTKQTDTTTLDNAILATFNPLPATFAPSITTTRDGNSCTRRVVSGEAAMLGVLKDEFRFGVCGVGVLCRLNVYGYVVWVKEEVSPPLWGQHLRSSGR